MNAAPEPIPLSGVQHAVYCLRQAALIHLERMWEDNIFTAEGEVLHAVADKGGSRSGRGVRRAMSLPLGSERLNLTGVADLVEFRSQPDGTERAYPVEYKRGKPKLHRADEAQLCAQALCLEEMTGRPVHEGALFYAQTKRRVVVPFDQGLRAVTIAAIDELNRIFATQITPAPTAHRSRCRACSLLDLCRPDTVSRPVRRWRDQMVARLLGGRVKTLLNTVYVTTEGAALSKDGENLVAEVEGAEKTRIPFHMLASVVAFGPMLLTPALIAACAERGISLALMGRNGRFQARVEGPVSGNVLLRRAQYRRADTPEDIVRSFVLGKVSNQRAILRRALRDHGPDMTGKGRETLETASLRMAMILRRVQMADATLDGMRGSEGEAANLYFAAFDDLIRSPDPELRWTGRSRRPPLDPANALLSFLYSMLAHDCRSACEAVGLDPAVGFLHRDRPGRPSLALDLMEELRAPLADRLALSLINRRQLHAEDFRWMDGGAVQLTDEARRSVLTAWQERKREERQHPFLQEKVPFGLVPYVQAQLLARHLRGDIDAYPPWFWS